MTELERCIHNYDWAAVLRRIQSHRHECYVVNSLQGRTPLHEACDHGAPAVVIQSLCQVYPEATVRTGTSNMNPLHITCSSPQASVHVVRVLLEWGASEQSSMRDVDGDTPLHAACRCGASMEVLELLLWRADRTAAAAVWVRDYEGLTPLLRLWVRYFVILGLHNNNDDNCSDSDNNNDDSDTIVNRIHTVADIQGELLEVWNKTELLLRYAHYGSLVVVPRILPSLSSSSSFPSLSSLQQQQQQQVVPARMTMPNHNLHSVLSRVNSFTTLFQNQSHVSSLSSRTTIPNNNNNNNTTTTITTTIPPPLLVQRPCWILHAAAAMDCPRPVLQIATRIYHPQLTERDEQGRTPLMVACAAPIYPVHNLSSDGYTLDDDDDRRHHDHHEMVPRTTTTNPQQQQRPSVIQLLLQAHANPTTTTTTTTTAIASLQQQHDHTHGGADVMDPSGRLPLHIAIESGKAWYDGIDALVQFYPESVTMTDRSTKLFPYQLAAATTKGNDHVNNCYALLRLNPTVLWMVQPQPPPPVGVVVGHHHCPANTTNCTSNNNNTSSCSSSNAPSSLDDTNPNIGDITATTITTTTTAWTPTTKILPTTTTTAKDLQCDDDGTTNCSTTTTGTVTSTPQKGQHNKRIKLDRGES
jgi:ankyrin repeat protein